jgi:hypothetical protein
VALGDYMYWERLATKEGVFDRRIWVRRRLEAMIVGSLVVFLGEVKRGVADDSDFTFQCRCRRPELGPGGE